MLLTLEEPTGPMRKEAASAGYYLSPGWQQKYPRLQILTAEALLDGYGIEMPPLRQTSATFKQAPRARRDPGHTQGALDL